ncbi:hypothetical protein [Mycobacterium sp.]|uniref:hypothetical protein n=1 Tax=Mycobacterium sp. TaxID=1785 RepID=UPI0025E17EA7|nr:hypothetical protein [Mycobacterium sp.]
MQTKVVEMLGEKLLYRALGPCRAPWSVGWDVDVSVSTSPTVGLVSGRPAIHRPTSATTVASVALAARPRKAGVR